MSEYVKVNMTLGNIITILVIGCGLIAGWVRMDMLAQQQNEMIAEHKAAIHSNTNAIQQLQNAFNDKLSVKEAALRNEIDKRDEQLRITLARTDARLEALSKDIGEIKSSQRSMETNIGWLAKKGTEVNR